MDFKAILLWHDVKVSAIVFVSGFVLLVCLTQLNVVSVLTNIALVCLASMLALRLLFTARSAFLRSKFEHPLKFSLFDAGMTTGAVEDLVNRINELLDEGTSEETHALLQKPEGKFPIVLNRSAFLYHHGLRKVKQRLLKERGESHLSYDVICKHLKVLTAVVVVNEAIENNISTQLIEKLDNAGLITVEESLSSRYLTQLITDKEDKKKNHGVGKDDLTQIELQGCVETVNNVVQEERVLADIVRRVNTSLDKDTVKETHTLLQKPEGKFPEVLNRSAFLYHDELRKVKQQIFKENGHSQVSYEVICQHLRVLTPVVVVNEAIEKKNATQLIEKLNNAGLKSVEGTLFNRYLTQLITAKDKKRQEHGKGKDDLTQIELQNCIHVVNTALEEERVYIVQRINKSLDEDTVKETHTLLQKPEGQFPEVLNRSAFLYHEELRKVKQQILREKGQSQVSYEVICQHLRVLTPVVVVNEAIEKKNSTQLIEKLNNAGLKFVEGSLWNRYLAQLITAKDKKCQEHGKGKDDLTQVELQNCVFIVNNAVQEESIFEDIVQRINKSLDKDTVKETHTLLQKPEGKLPEVLNRSAFLYHDELRKVKQQILKENGQSQVSYKVICQHLRVLTPVVVVNEAIEKKNSTQLIEKLNNAGLKSVEGTLLNNYLTQFITAKDGKRQKYGKGKDDLTQNELQNSVHIVNNAVHLEDIVQRINKSLDKDTVKETHALLQKPEGRFPEVLNRSAFLYHDELRKVKQQIFKENGQSQVSYKVICQHLRVLTPVVVVNEAIEKKNSTQLIEKLNNAGLTSLEESLFKRYLTQLITAKDKKRQEYGKGKDDLTQIELQNCVHTVNTSVQEERVLEDIVQRINKSLDKDTVKETHTLLQKPEGKFPEVLNRSAFLYHDELRKVKQQVLKETGQSQLSYKVICQHSRVLTSVVVVNEAIEKKNSTQLIEKLNNAGLKSVEGILLNRYLTQLITAKDKKCQECGKGKDDLTQIELQNCVHTVNTAVQEERVLEDIVQRINKSLDKDTVKETHTLLQKPEGKFPEVLNRSAYLYHDELRKVKQQVLKENGQSQLSCKVICQHLRVLTPVVVVNEAIEKKNSTQLIEKLNNAGLTSVEGTLFNRYLTQLITSKDKKRQECGKGKDDLTQIELQNCVHTVNTAVQEERVLEDIVQRINKSLDKDTVKETHTLLQKPEGKFPEVLNRSAYLYHDELRKVKQQVLKEKGQAQVSYKVICQQLRVLTPVVVVNEAIEKENSTQLIEKLNNAGLKSVDGALFNRYLTQLTTAKDKKCQEYGKGKDDLTKTELQDCVDIVNVAVQEERALEDLVKRINESLYKGTSEETHTLLQKPEGKFPTVLNRSAFLYHHGLRKVKQLQEERGESHLSYDVICKHLKVLTAVVVVNEAIEKKDSTQLIEKLKNAGLTTVEKILCSRYLTQLVTEKEDKKRNYGVGKDDLTQTELQSCVDTVNTVVQEERVLADIVRSVNKSLDNDTVKETHTLLQKPEGKFPEVLNRSAFLYHDELRKVKQQIPKDGRESQLSYDVICKHLKVLTAVVVVNKAIEEKNSTQLTEKLNKVGLTSVEENLSNRYLTELMKAKEDKVQKCGKGKDDLTRSELESCVNAVNAIVQAERLLEDIVQLINKSLDKDTVKETHTLLQKPEGKFPEVLNRSVFLYHDELRKVKQQIPKERGDIQLSYVVICDQLKVLTAVVVVNEAIENKDSAQLIEKLNNAGLTTVEESLCSRYLSHLISAKEEKAQNYGSGKDDLAQVELQSCVDVVNTAVEDERALEDIIRRVNKSLDNDTVNETHTLLQKPEGKFPEVLNRSAFLYHDELCKVKQQILRENEQSYISHEVICQHLPALTLVAAVNEAIEKLNSPQLIEKLKNAGLTSVEERLCNRYLRHFIYAKERKIRKYGVGKDDLTKTELQSCVDTANTEDQKERVLHAAIVAINKAIDQQKAARTLKALREPSACLVDVFPDLAEDYQVALFQAKSNKATQAQAQSLRNEEMDNNNVTLLTHAEIQRTINEVFENLDETLIERLVGLTEMFPVSVRKGSCAAARGMVRVAKWLYSFTGKTLWIVTTSLVILAIPVIVEVERAHTREAHLQQQRQILLGPGSAGGGMGPAPPGYPSSPPEKQ